uniref:Uncharacterized protein n=1 Tax=viral metagenome TaxID=1070528 RepID=A0A6C0J195_9ZZZZ
MASLRLDVVNNQNNLVKSWKGEIDKDGKTRIIESYLNNGKPINEELSTRERLEELLFRCFNFTSKLCNYDELVGENSENLFCKKLRGSESVNDHHCAGSVQYNVKNEYLFLYLEIMFWNKYKVVYNHTLQNKEIDVRRSSGVVEKAFIGDYGLRWSNRKNEFLVKVLFEDKTLEKHITLLQVKELNPELEIKPIIDDIEDLPDWVNEIYSEWKQFIKENFKY